MLPCIVLLFSCSDNRGNAPLDFIIASENAVASSMKVEYKSELEFKKAMLKKFDELAEMVAKHYDFRNKGEFYQYYENFREKNTDFSDRVDRMNQVLSEFSQAKWPIESRPKSSHHHH